MGKTCRQRRAPLFFQNIQADAALGIHVRVVHLGFEVHFRGLERVVGGELFVLGGGSDWGAGSVDGATRKTIIEEKPSMLFAQKIALQCRSATFQIGALASGHPGLPGARVAAYRSRRACAVLTDTLVCVDITRSSNYSGTYVNSHEEKPTLVRRVRRAYDGCVPVENVIVRSRAGAARGGRVLLQIL